ncbi:MAG: transglutaminase-like domain-containing protein [Chloroflexota bacterium]|nr:transglutaminase-like domain-containing protein [Chloroflexota bacterium]MDQ5865689.1 transglutaminase-like domain-containing protein [Chloroflexota bacterium]
MYPLGGDPRSFYSRQSDLTDPGKQAHMYEDLPLTMSGMARMVQGLIVQLKLSKAYGTAPERELLQEAGTRRVERMLERIQARSQGSLTGSHSPERSLMGSSRDYAVLLTSMLRHRGIPARARCGFARYMGPDMHYGRWVCEYWQEREMRWVIVDAGMLDEAARSPHLGRFDPLDVPHTRFVAAGKAWQMCRIWRADPRRFGQDRGSRGLGYVASQLVRDLACLNKVEMLPDDAWGLAHTAFDYLWERDLRLLDRVAHVTLAGNEAFPELRALYELEVRLRVPAVINSYVNDTLQAEYLVA